VKKVNATEKQIVKEKSRVQTYAREGKITRDEYEKFPLRYFAEIEHHLSLLK